MFALALAATLMTGQKEADIKLLPTPLCPGRINPMQSGQFMEYLCTLFPGMWAEKLTDGGFEGLSPYKVEYIKATDNREKPWYPSGFMNRATYTLDTDHPINGATCQKISLPEGPRATVGISQDGIAVDPKAPCNVGLYLRQTGVVDGVTVSLAAGGKTLASAHFSPNAGWKKYTATLTPTQKTDNATFTISYRGPGTIWIDAASLMPTNAIDGWRPDVVAALKKLNPHVIRIGGSVLDDGNLGDFQWTDTLGEPDQRKPFRAWGGLQPTGPGMEEFLNLCRIVKAEPLICVRFTDRSPQDAADEVEYFNGATTTRMGALRAKNGHAEPYHVKYWQVGNERWGADYWNKAPDFCRAMRAVDPNIKLLSSYPNDELVKTAGQYLDYMCPHHYQCDNLTAESEDFARVRQMIATYAPGRDIKVAVTEWNTTGGDWGVKRAALWNLSNALACARYQNLMQRNADLVEIANRSNLTNSFCSGIIQTNNAQLYETPTYYAQMLYSNLAEAKPLTIEPPAPLKAGLDVSATLSEDGKQLTLFCVNDAPDVVHKNLDLSALKTRFGPLVRVWTLEDSLNALEPDVTNSFDHPLRVGVIRRVKALAGHRFSYEFPPYSLTVLRFQVPVAKQARG